MLVPEFAKFKLKLKFSPIKPSVGRLTLTAGTGAAATFELRNSGERLNRTKASNKGITAKAGLRNFFFLAVKRKFSLRFTTTRNFFKAKNRK